MHENLLYTLFFSSFLVISSFSVEPIYTNLLTSCKLTKYLADIDKQAEDMFFRLVNQLTEKEGVTEQLKADNQMLWVARMNNIRNRAEEIVYQEIIYT